MQSLVAEVIKLYRDAFETKREDARLFDRVNGSKNDLEGVQSVDWLACKNVKVS